MIRVRMAHPHYAGNLVDGAHMLSLFGDVATELCIRAFGDEGLFRAYESVEFLAPVYAGDFIEAEGEIVRWGTSSMGMRFVASKVITPTHGPTDADPAIPPSAAGALVHKVVVCRAQGTCVVPKSLWRTPQVGESFGRPEPLVLTAAIVGAETTREQTPHLPITPEEIGIEAARCAEAGAQVIHLHVRDEAGRPSQDTERFRAAILAIRSRCDVIIQTSTGGAVGMSIQERCGPLYLSLGLTPNDAAKGANAPDMATLNVGTINFGDDIFVNRRQDTMEVARLIQTAGIAPEIEIYDLGHLDITAELIEKGLLRPPFHVQFVLGVRGALSATEENLELLVSRLAKLNGPSTWGVAGIGRHEFPMVEAAARLGGNVRVGLEDNIFLEKGVLAQGSSALCKRAAELCQKAGRKLATVAEARSMLLGVTSV